MGEGPTQLTFTYDAAKNGAAEKPLEAVVDLAASKRELVFALDGSRSRIVVVGIGKNRAARAALMAPDLHRIQSTYADAEWLYVKLEVSRKNDGASTLEEFRRMRIAEIESGFADDSIIPWRFDPLTIVDANRFFPARALNFKSPKQEGVLVKDILAAEEFTTERGHTITKVRNSARQYAFTVQYPANDGGSAGSVAPRRSTFLVGNDVPLAAATLKRVDAVGAIWVEISELAQDDDYQLVVRKSLLRYASNGKLSEWYLLGKAKPVNLGNRKWLEREFEGVSQYSVSDAGAPFTIRPNPSANIYELCVLEGRGAKTFRSTPLALGGIKADVSPPSVQDRTLIDEMSNLSRTQITTNANTWSNFEWTVRSASRGSEGKCDASTDRRRPKFLQAVVDGAVAIGVPYGWGCKHSLQKISDKLNDGSGLAGDVCADSKLRGHCLEGVVGIDCSGFIARAWDLPKSSFTHGPGTDYFYKYFPKVRFPKLCKGDALVKAGSHIMLYDRIENSTSGLLVWVTDAAISDAKGKVENRAVKLEKLKGYSPIRRHNVVEASGECGAEATALLSAFEPVANDIARAQPVTGAMR
ncbi:MAG: hypothetical protein LH481_03600 [Burkholderiales bacterium]|nr:hypothetical protein [Burkholderiales bacterium]